MRLPCNVAATKWYFLIVSDNNALNRVCLRVSHNAVYRNSLRLSVNDSIQDFDWVFSGNSSDNLHWGKQNAVNMPYCKWIIVSHIIVVISLSHQWNSSLFHWCNISLKFSHSPRIFPKPRLGLPIYVPGDWSHANFKEFLRLKSWRYSF